MDTKPFAVHERSFHLLMGALLFGSLLLDRALRGVLPTWNPPAVGLLTLVLGLVWIGLFASYRHRLLDDQLRVLRDRAERQDRKIAALEDVIRHTHGL